MTLKNKIAGSKALEYHYMRRTLKEFVKFFGEDKVRTELIKIIVKNKMKKQLKIMGIFLMVLITIICTLVIVLMLSVRSAINRVGEM